MIGEPIHLRCDRKSQRKSRGFHNKSVNCVTCWQQCSPLVYCAPFQWAPVFPQLVFMLNAPALWRNACPYIPSTAKSHWSLSQSEQTIVKHQNKNEKKKNTEPTSLWLIRTFQGRRERYWTVTWHLLTPFFASKVLVYLASSMWKKHLQLHIKTHISSTLLLSIC